MKPEAIIFDMDGTLINNNYYHFLAWQAFYKQNNRSITLDEYKTTMSGRTSLEIFQNFFGKKMTREELTPYANEKNRFYRLLYTPHIKPVAGLIPLLETLKSAGIPMSVATSGTPVNVRFMFDNVPIEQFFDHVVNATDVVRGKPDPEIFLKAATYAKANPARCIAFEDSLAGIASAKAAGMKVVGITTTETKETLADADAVINDFTEVTIAMLEQLMN